MSNDNGSRQRKSDKLINLVDMTKLFLFLVGGGLAGTGYTLIAPTNAQLDFKVSKIEERILNHEKRIINNNSKIDLTTKTIGDYVEKMEAVLELREKLESQKFKNLDDKIGDIKSDVKEIKDILKNRK